MCAYSSMGCEKQLDLFLGCRKVIGKVSRVVIIGTRA
jgi:hypothetical protein